MHAGANLTPCVGTSSARPDLRIDKDRPDYTVYCDASASMKLAEALRWFWWMTVIGPMTRSGRWGDLGRGGGAVSEELGRLESVHKTGGGARRIVINFWDDNSGS